MHSRVTSVLVIQLSSTWLKLCYGVVNKGMYSNCDKILSRGLGDIYMDYRTHDMRAISMHDTNVGMVMRTCADLRKHSSPNFRSQSEYVDPKAT